jgi:hypothetical protein
MNQNFGFDMVYIGSQDFRLKGLDGWSVKSGNKVGDTPEPFAAPCRNGFQPSGAGYFMNRGKETPNLCTWELNKYGLFAQVNPSTLNHEYHLTTDLKGAKDALLGDMSMLGIEMDLNTASVNRVDITKQQSMPFPIHSYTTALTALKGKRMKATSYPNGYTFGNRQKEAVFYDKTTQLREVKGFTGDVPVNLLRCEARWKKRKVIGHDINGLGKGDFASLVSMDAGEANHRFKGFMESQIFRTSDGTQLELNFETEVEILKQFTERNERGGWKDYFMAEGIESILHRAGSLQVVESLLESVGYNRSQVWRIMKQLRDLMQVQGFIDSRRGEVSISQTIETLRQTFAA